jgi:hypothetical protein
MRRDHLSLTNETYLQHARAALYMARKAAKMAVVLVVHAVLPDTFAFTGSKTLAELNKFQKERLRKTDPLGEEG